MSEAQEPHAGDSGAPQGPPPTHFQVLCGSLAAQVHMALGLIPDPVDKQTRVEVGVAKQGIDMLAMLEEKTQGNLDEEEAKTLSVLLTQLRMIFVERVKELSQGDDPERSPEGGVEGQPGGEAASAGDDGPKIVTP